MEWSGASQSPDFGRSLTWTHFAALIAVYEWLALHNLALPMFLKCFLSFYTSFLPFVQKCLQALLINN